VLRPVVAALLAGALAPAQAAPPPELTISLLGAPETVFAWRRDRCETIDTPDTPARAFRDAQGVVHLVSSHEVVREMTGPTLDEVRPHCAVVFRSALDRRYSSHRNHEWLAGFYTEDGRTVHALVHNEFHGSDDAALCAALVFERCWWNSVTYAVSNDGGTHFEEAKAGNRLVAALPYAYAPDGNSPAGYFNPTNIVALHGDYYAIIKATAYRAQQEGSCVIRTAELDRADSWRAWDGSGFGVRFLDRPAAKAEDPGAHVCTPIGVWLADVGGLARDETSGAFVGVSQGQIAGDGGQVVCGIWASASYDLVAWSKPVLIRPDPANPVTCDPASDLYPSLLDPESRTRNFESFGASPYLYFVRADLAHPPYDRRLMRQRVAISLHPRDAAAPPHEAPQDAEAAARRSRTTP
jgi:hypothetical protein